MIPLEQPTAVVFCIADHPVLEALLTVVRDVASSGAGLRSADDYRRWYFVVHASVHEDRFVLPPDAPGLDQEDFLPGFHKGIVELFISLDGFNELAPIEGTHRCWYTRSHALLTEEPLEDYVRDHGFEVLRVRDLLARERNQPRSQVNDVFSYEQAIGDEAFVADDRIAAAYVLGRLDELPPTLTPSAAYFEALPALPHPSHWTAHDHRSFDVLCRARAFERISFVGHEVCWAESIHAWGAELERRGASPLEAFRGLFGRMRTLAENLELVAASERLRRWWPLEPSLCEAHIAAAKVALVEQLGGELAFDDLDEDEEGGEEDEEDEEDEEEEDDEAEQAEPEAPADEPIARVRRALEFTHYHLSGAWVHDELVIVISDDQIAFRSTDAGRTWTAAPLPVDNARAIDGRRLDDGRLLLVVVGHGAAYSWDLGETWLSSRMHGWLLRVAVASDGRVCVTAGAAWAVSDDPAELPMREDPFGLQDVTFDDGRFYAVGIEGSVLTLEHDGWQRLSKSMDAIPGALAVRGDRMTVLATEGVAISDDGGRSWTWTALAGLTRAHAAAIDRDGTRTIVAGRVLASDDGLRWRVVHVGDRSEARGIALGEHAAVVSSWRTIALVGRESTTALRFGGPGSAECFDSYPLTEHGFAMASFPGAERVTALFADGDRLLLGLDDGLMVSEDRGRSFVAAVAPLRGREVRSIVAHRGELWAACGGLLRSSDGGYNWVDVEAPLITRLLATADGALFGVRGEWLLRHDGQASWLVCRRFEQDIDLLVSDLSGGIHVIADDPYCSPDGGRTWISLAREEFVFGIVPLPDALLMCNGETLWVPRDGGHSFVARPLPLHIDSRERGRIHALCGTPSGELYFSSEDCLLYSSDFGHTLARVRTPFLEREWVHHVFELWGRQYLLLDYRGLLERVDASALPITRRVEIEV